jgi:hypothetical protein
MPKCKYKSIRNKITKGKAEKNKNQKKKRKLTLSGSFPFLSYPFPASSVFGKATCQAVSTPEFPLFFSLTAGARLSSLSSFLPRARPTPRPTPPRRRTDFFRAQTLPTRAPGPAALFP